MLVNSKVMLSKARKDKKAVFQFNINNLEWTKCILEECNRLNTDVILGASEKAIEYMGGYQVVVAICKELLESLSLNINVCLHLDHGSSIESCKKAIDCGFTSVMLDFSKRSLEENIEATKKVVNYARKYNVSVEAELGIMGSIQDTKLEISQNTNLEDCINFVKKTEIDSLAPTVGTVHGIYKKELNIDYELIKKISENIDLPLVLHGGSGLSNEVLQKCVESGITKININSDLQEVWSQKVREYLLSNDKVIDPRKIIASGFEAIKNEISFKMNINKE